MIYTAKITKEIVRCYLSYRNNLDAEASVPCVTADETEAIADVIIRETEIAAGE